MHPSSVETNCESSILQLPPEVEPEEELDDDPLLEDELDDPPEDELPDDDPPLEDELPPDEELDVDPLLDELELLTVLQSPALPLNELLLKHPGSCPPLHEGLPLSHI